MKNREKILAIAFVVIIILWRGSGMIQSWVFDPISSREKKIKDLKSKISLLEKNQDITLEKQVAFRERKGQSLPADPSVASTLYQHWLIEELARAGLNEISVVPGRGSSRLKDYTVVTMTMSARGHLGKMCDFLSRFQSVPLLHRISRIRINNSEATSQEPDLEFTVVSEALSFADGEIRTTLLPTEKDLSPVIASIDRSSLNSVVENNLFKKYRKPDAVVVQERPVVNVGPPPMPPQPPPFDPTPHIFLVGSVGSGDKLVGWLYDRTENKKVDLIAGSKLDIAGIKGDVMSVHPDHVIFKTAEGTYRLELGHSLNKRIKMVEATSGG